MYLVPGISWKRSPTRNGLTVADYISTTTNVIVARMLCAYSRDSVVWLSYALDLRQATRSRAAQPLYNRNVTSLPIDSSNRNIVINWLVKPLLIWVYSTVRGYDTPSSVPVHHRQVYDTTWLNFTKIYALLECTWYLVSVVEAEPDTKWVDRA